MNRLIILVSGIFLAHNGFGAVVHGARLDASQQNLLVDVGYSGGCTKPHVFTLKVGRCLESLPVQCTVDLVDNSFDACEMYVKTTAVFSLKKFGFADKYFSGGMLTIQGDKNASGEYSAAAVRLP